MITWQRAIFWIPSSKKLEISEKVFSVWKCISRNISSKWNIPSEVTGTLYYECFIELFQTETEAPDVVQYEVVEVQSQTQIDRQKAGMSLQGLKFNRQMSEGVQSPQDPEEESGKLCVQSPQLKQTNVWGCLVSR